MKRFILIALLALSLFACDSDNPPPLDNTVHLAGILAPTGGAHAGYWKDGVHTELAPGWSSSNVTSLYVDGTSVLIGGYKINYNSPPHLVVYWQDGVDNVIEGGFGSPTLIASRNDNFFGVWHDIPAGWVFKRNGTTQPMIDTAFDIGPNALALLGDDMYIAGNSLYHDGSSPDNPILQHAQYWKNGQLIFRESELSNALAIFIHQNDIYMAGYFDNPTSQDRACYWKNGDRFNLTGVNAMALSVFVTDAHVYVSGVMDHRAVYWKDGEMIFLTEPGPYSAANSIFVQGTDVHVAGTEHGYPAYWKNDVKQDIANQDIPGAIKFMVVGSN